MATSGTYSFNQTVQQIIELAFFHIGKYGNGRTIGAEDYNIALAILNGMIKAWAADLHLWAKQEGIVFLEQYQGLYRLDDSVTAARFANKEDTVTKMLAGNTLAGATVLVLDNTTGMVNGEAIGIVLDSGALFWTTIVTVNSITNVTIAAPLPGAAAQSQLVFAYLQRANKPLRILDARLIEGFDYGASTSQIELPMTVIAYQDYWQIAAVTLNAQVPNQYTYNPKSTEGNLYIWPRPMDCSYRMQITYERELQDLTNVNDNFDLPVEWLEPLQWQLALRLCPGYGKLEKMSVIAQIASERLEALKDWDNEISYVQITPTVNYYE